MKYVLSLVWLVTVMVAALPMSSFAQSGAGSISGTVRDTSGAVLPGVTVEASSPALIEKVRTAVTDSAGQYRIIELRSGTYTVTFSLAGFTGFKREGIEITSGFTATVSADLQVGNVAETVTVTGESPVVDVQSTRSQVVLSREVVDTIPSGKSFQNLAALVPGVTIGGGGLLQQDVGGSSGANLQVMFVHGGRESDMQTHIDGMPTQSYTSIARSAHALSDGNIQELALETAGNSSEVEGGGIRVNMVPREGGNVFHGGFIGDYSPMGLQGDNLDDELRASGVTSVNKADRLWSINPTFGGPIVRDRLWFFGSYKESRADNVIANSYVNSNPAAWNYVPDLSRPAISKQTLRDGAARFTWQASARAKIAVFADKSYVCQCHLFQNGPVRTEAATETNLHNHIVQGTVASPVTNRLLIEGGISTAPAHQIFDPRPEAVASRIVDTGLGVTYRGPAVGTQNSITDTTIWSGRGAASYVTGTHAAKVGMTLSMGELRQTQRSPVDDVTYTALNGVPTGVTYYGTPITVVNRVRPNIGVFAQDVWTLKRVTANFGVRFDYFRSGFPDQHIEPTRYVRVAREFAGQEDLVSWRDLSPRLGLAWDVFGSGRTAVKVSANRYVLQQGTNIAGQVNPIASNNSNPRPWTDNGDRIVQGDPFNPLLNDELGPSTNPNFGRPVVSYALDPDWAHGFQVRPANWEFAGGVQQELVGGMAVNFSVFRRIYTNFLVSDLPNVTRADFSYYCLTAPQDARLPGGGGQQICDIPDLKPERLATAGTAVGTPADKFGDQKEHWTGFDATVTARLVNMLLQGGVSSGKTMLDNCDIVDDVPEIFFSTPPPVTPIPWSSALSLTGTPAPGAPPITGAVPTSRCHVESKMLTQLKLLGSYDLPWRIQVAATFQSVPGPQLAANATYTAAQVIPALGRAPVQGTATVNLIEPGTAYGERMNQLDLRFSKDVAFGRTTVKGMIDLYNSLNDNAVLLVNTTYGATAGPAAGRAWIPTQVLSPRIVKFGVQVRF